MIIVNDPKTQPARFAQFNLTKFKGHLTKDFLDRLVHRDFKTGVQRSNYWLLRTESLIRFTTRDVQTEIIIKLIDWSLNRGFDYLMFIDK